MSKKGLEYKFLQLESKVEGMIKKVDDMYIITPYIIDSHVSSINVTQHAIKYLDNYSYIFNYSTATERKDFTNELIEIYYAKKKGNLRLYCYHYFKLIEFVINKFIFEKPGLLEIENVITNPNKETEKDIIDLHIDRSRNKPDKKWDKTKWIVDYLRTGKLSMGDKKTIFERLIYSENSGYLSDKSKRVYVKGAELCPSFDNWNTFFILKYYRDQCSHPGTNVTPDIKNDFILNQIRSYDNDPEILFKSSEPKQLLNAYLFLYNEYLKGNIKV